MSSWSFTLEHTLEGRENLFGGTFENSWMQLSAIIAKFLTKEAI